MGEGGSYFHSFSLSVHRMAHSAEQNKSDISEPAREILKQFTKNRDDGIVEIKEPILSLPDQEEEKDDIKDNKNNKHNKTTAEIAKKLMKNKKQKRSAIINNLKSNKKNKNN